MDNKNIDRRVRKTKQLLLSGLTRLMEEKSIKDITVRELSDLVDINRGTFYLHYRDVYDMLEKVEEEIFEEFISIFENYNVQKIKSPLLLLTEIFKFIESRSDFARVMLGKNGDIAFVEKLKGIVKNKWLHDWINEVNKEKSKYSEYRSSFIVSGFVGLLQDWLNGNINEAPEEMSIFAEQMIAKGIKVFS